MRIQPRLDDLRPVTRAPNEPLEELLGGQPLSARAFVDEGSNAVPSFGASAAPARSGHAGRAARGRAYISE